MDAKKCTECGRICIPLASAHNIKTSEWYCDKCHKSYPMVETDAKVILTMERRSIAGEGK